jgi:hypothetical protein
VTGRTFSRCLAGAGLGLLSGAVLAPAAASLRIRATEAMAPCAAAAATAYAATGGEAAVVETGPLEAAADVLVGGGIEITRALESGAGRDDSDVAVTDVPWTLVLADRAPAVKSVEEAVRAGIEIEVLGGPSAHEAKRFLEGKSARTRDNDGPGLRRAEAALVPVSLAGPGRRLAVEVPALTAQAAVGRHSAAEAAARRFVAYLASPRGREAFAACLQPR